MHDYCGLSWMLFILLFIQFGLYLSSSEAEPGNQKNKKKYWTHRAKFMWAQAFIYRRAKMHIVHRANKNTRLIVLKGHVHLEKVGQVTENYLPELQKNESCIRIAKKSIYFKISSKEFIHFDVIFRTYAMP